MKKNCDSCSLEINSNENQGFVTNEFYTLCVDCYNEL